MTDHAVEIRNVTKIFSSGKKDQEEKVWAVREMELDIAQGEFFTLLGPSGCGKTTTLRLIAGFEQPTEGEVFIMGKSMTNTPPNHRPVNTVFQNYALFPHMNVAKNVGFGLTIKRTHVEEKERRVAEALEMVQMGGMGNRKPSQLSGGQQQRVALARALVNKPSVLLLDEPLGALDLKLRKAMQIELKHLQEQVGITFVYVTHDQEEALTMSDRIAVMKDGLIQQLGDPLTLYEKPVNRFVADFIGESNLLMGTVQGMEEGRVILMVGEEKVLATPHSASIAQNQDVPFTIRPERMMLSSEGEESSPGLAGEIKEVVYIGTDIRYLVHLISGSEVTVRIQNSRPEDYGAYTRGMQVRVSWNPGDARTLSD